MIVPKKHVNLHGELKYFEVKGSKVVHILEGDFAKIVVPVFSAMPKKYPTYFSLKAGTLDDSSWLKIDSNFFTDSAQDWNKPSDAPKSFSS